MHLRRTKNYGRIFTGKYTNEGLSIQDKRHPEMKMIHSESRYYIEKAINELPDKLRPIFIMIVVEGLNIEAVSKYLDVTTVNVRVRLYHAKKILQGKLAHFSDLGYLYTYGFKHCDKMVKNGIIVILEKERHSVPDTTLNKSA